MRGARLQERYDSSLAREIVDELIRIEVVDRSLALASRLFVAVIPLSIIISATVPGADNFGDSLIERLELTGHGAQATRELFATSGAARGAIGILGVVILVYSVFSFARGLQRVYVDLWRLEPQKVEALVRRATWIAGFVAYTAVLSPVRDYALRHDMRPLYAVVALVLGAVFWIWTPYVLLGRRIEWRRLLPTGLLTATGITAFSVASAVYVPHTFTENAERYGLVGVAFGLVSWLFAYAGVVIVCAVLAHSWDERHAAVPEVMSPDR